MSLVLLTREGEKTKIPISAIVNATSDSFAKALVWVNFLPGLFLTGMNRICICVVSNFLFCFGVLHSEQTRVSQVPQRGTFQHVRYRATTFKDSGLGELDFIAHSIERVSGVIIGNYLLFVLSVTLISDIMTISEISFRNNHKQDSIKKLKERENKTNKTQR